ncbi:clostripain-related cysteine peptidase [Anaerolineales bacterium HSG25]|nr:clostripain-related cysteine peptidase [Anaerolineales bacterium HSG25]
MGNPASPNQVGSSNARYGYGVFVSGNYAYVATYNQLNIISINTPLSPTLVSSFGYDYNYGNGININVSGDYAYITDQEGLLTIDVSDPLNPKAGQLYVSNQTNDIFISGDSAYVATGNSLQILDVSNLTTTPMAGQITGVSSPQDIDVDGNYAYVADSSNGLKVFTVTNPTLPTLAASYNTSGYAYGVQRVGNYAYVADSSRGLKIIDISNPTSPTLTGSYDTPGEAYGVQIVGIHAYVADSSSGLQIINISNPTSPTLTGSYDTLGYARDVQIVGNYAYVADYYSLQIINVNNPAAPTLAGSYGGYFEKIHVSGDYAYAVSYGGLSIINVSNPAIPTEAGYYSGNFNDIQVIGNNAYVTSQNRLLLLNVSDPANPTPIGGYLTGNTSGLHVNGTYAYVTSDNELQIYDITTNPFIQKVGELETMEMGGSANIQVVGNYAYSIISSTIRSTSKMNIVDVNNPSALVTVGSYVIQENVADSHISGNHAYFLTRNENNYSSNISYTVQIFDVSNPTAPSWSSSYGPISVQNAYDGTGFYVKNNYAYIAAGDSLQIINVSNPVAPSSAGSLNMGRAVDVHVDENYAYVVDNDGTDRGLKIVSISNPSVPLLAGSYSNSANFSHVYKSGDYAYLTGRWDNKLYIINVSNPVAPFWVSTYTLLDYAKNVHVAGDYAYVPIGNYESGKGVQIIDVSNPSVPTDAGIYDLRDASYDVDVSGDNAYIAAGSGGLHIIGATQQMINITKTASITAAQPGDTVTYQVQLQSDGLAVVTATLTDTLPFGLDYQGSLTVTGLEPAYGCLFENSTNEIRCQGAITTTGATLTYQAKVSSTLAPGSILNNNVIVSWSDKWNSASASVVIQDTAFTETLVIIYASMDNNLSDDGLRLLNNAELGAGNPHVKTLLMIDGPGNDDSFVYRLEKEKDPANPFCPTYNDQSCGGRYVLGQNLWEGNESMGSPYSLVETLQAIQWAYPNAQNVDQLALALVGHGDGISYNPLLGQPAHRTGQPGGGLLIDENPHPSSLSTKELGLALAAFHTQTGNKIGLLYLDACLMGMAEVAAEIQDSVEFVLFSENIAWATFPYDAHLNSINGTMDPKQIGEAWFDNEKLVLEEDDYPYTLSLIDLTKMPNVLTKINSLGQDLTSRAADDTGRDQIKQIRQQTDCFDSNQNWALDDNDNYCDIVSFAEAIKTEFGSSSAEANAAQTLIDAVKQAVVKESHMNGIPWNSSGNSWTWGDLGGLSIYLPISEDNCKRDDYTKKHFRFVEETEWDTFLSAYWQGAEPPVVEGCNDPTLPPPPPPIKLEVEASTNVQLEWNAISIDEYRIKRQNGAGTAWTTLVENHGSGTYSDNNSLVVGQTYCYQVEKMDETKLSNTVCINYGTLELWTPELNSPANETILVPINLKNNNGLCFAAGNITLNYDSAIVTPTGYVTATAFTTGYDFVSNIEHANQVRIATMSDACVPLSGPGSLFMVEFEVIGSENDISPLDFVTGLTNTVIYDTADLFTPAPLALENGSLTVQGTCGLGDVNCDGFVNAADALLALRIAVGSFTSTAAQAAACDVNGDDDCTAADATMILNFSVTQKWSPRTTGSRLASRQTTQPTTIGLSNFTGQAGETATMWVRLQHAPDMAGGDFSLIYDETMMSATDTALIVGGFSSAANLQTAGQIRFALASKSSINKDSELFKITFQLKKDIDSNPIIPAQVQVDLNDGSGLDFETNLQRTIEVEIYQRATVYLPVMIK